MKTNSVYKKIEQVVKKHALPTILAGSMLLTSCVLIVIVIKKILFLKKINFLVQIF